jgi:hypothetical protein
MYVAFLTAIALSTAVQTAPARAHINVGSWTHAAAAEGQGGRAAAMRFRQMDTNNDGVITRAEWQGSPESFRVHDWNRDGVLSGDEVRPGAYRNDPYDERDYNSGDSQAFDSWTPAAFANLDANRDGRISTREWHFDMDTFRRVDRDRDGVLSRAEFLGENQDDDRADRFEYLDTNNDGHIERREWHSGIEEFNWLDRNRDGVLSRAELVGAPGARSDEFASLDDNGNGVISPDEWHWSRRSFEQRDTNNDGVLSRRELATPAGGATANHEVVRVDAKQTWNDTGVFVRAGDVVTIHADGTIQLSDNPSDVSDPGGARSGRRAPNAPIGTAPAGALIARIGDSAPILVGANGTINRAPATGRLFLGVNDDHFPDNSGEFRATVDIDRDRR